MTLRTRSFVSGVLCWNDEHGAAEVAQKTAEVARFRKVASSMPPAMAEVVRRRYGLERPKLGLRETAEFLQISANDVAALERVGVARLHAAFGDGPR
jgi:hypothetical protein